MSRKEDQSRLIAAYMSTLDAECTDRRLFGDAAEQVAALMSLTARIELYRLLKDFRHWDGTVDLHEDRLPLQRPRMVGSCQHARSSPAVALLRQWCVERSANAASLHKMRWWLETVLAFFEIRSRWGIRDETRT